jgi:hypothetical protein
MGRNQVMVAVGVALCLAAAAYYGMVAPAVQQIISARTTIATLDRALAEQRALSQTDLRGRLHEAGIFSLEEANSLGGQLAEIAASAGAKLTDLSLQEPKAVLVAGGPQAKSRYKVHEVQMKARFEGGYPSLMKLMGALEGHNPPILVSAASLRAAGSDPAVLQADVSASIFLLLTVGTGGSPLSASAPTPPPAGPSLGGSGSPFESPTAPGASGTLTVKDLGGGEGGEGATVKPAAPARTDPVPIPPGLVPGAIPPPAPPPSVTPRPGGTAREVAAFLTGTVAGPDGGLAVVQVGRHRYNFRPGDVLSQTMRLQAVSRDAVVLRVAGEDVTVTVGEQFPQPVEPPEAEEASKTGETPRPRVAYATAGRASSPGVRVASRARAAP